jgi:hypothetical protein
MGSRSPGAAAARSELSACALSTPGRTSSGARCALTSCSASCTTTALASQWSRQSVAGCHALARAPAGAVLVAHSSSSS